MPDYFAQYKAKIDKRNPISLPLLQVGDIIEFNYTGPNAENKDRIVFVLNPKFQQKLHGLVLNKISPMIFWFFYHNTLKHFIKEKSVSKKFTTYIQHKVPSNSMAFYNVKIKPWMKKDPTKGEGSPYRIYNLSNMNTIKLLEWKK
jgi:hypothetical protein